MDTSYPTRLIALSLLVTFLALSSITVIYNSHHYETTKLNQRNTQVHTLSARILLFDEQLTSSALLAVYSGENTWIPRHQKIEQQLRAVIAEVMQSVSTTSLEYPAKHTERANEKLALMEKKALDLISAGKPIEAKSILTGEAYKKQKLIYSQGIKSILAILDTDRANNTARLNQRIDKLAWLIPICFVVSLLLWTAIYRSLKKWRVRFNLEECRRYLAETEVRKFNNQLELRIQERTAQLNDSRQQLVNHAHFDDLTGLPNRRHGLKELQSRLSQRKHNTEIAVMLVDLDNFKRVNDNLGHAVGDKLLNQAAKRLQEQIPDSALVARLGGDEFLIVSDQTAGIDRLNVADRIIEAFQTPFDLGKVGFDLPITPSIGLAIAPQHGTTADQLMRNSDTAMYYAKETGRNTACTFVIEMNERLNRRLQLESELRLATESFEEFHLVYQPKVNLENDQIVGVEALLRWTHPDEGVISPAEFVPVAEESGQIIKLGQWVLNEAIKQAVTWREEHGMALNLCVNVASQQLQQQGFFETVEALLTKHGLSPELLGIEITERSLLGNDQITHSNIASLCKLGVKLLMDDFGTGYSALSYLQNYPFDYLKIDRSFINSIPNKTEDLALVRGIINMSHDIHLKVIAEGAETAEQVALLRTIGCDLVQGYYFSKPLSPENLVDFYFNWPITLQSRVFSKIEKIVADQPPVITMISASTSRQPEISAPETPVSSSSDKVTSHLPAHQYGISAVSNCAKSDVHFTGDKAPLSQRAKPGVELKMAGSKAPNAKKRSAA